MKQNEKILYFARYIPAYRIPILNQLNEALEGELVVCAGEPLGTSSVLRAAENQEEEYTRVHLRNRFWRGDKIHYQAFRPAFESFPNPRVVLAEESPRSMSLPFLLREARTRGAGRVLWGIFYSVHRPFSKRHPLQYYRLRMARSVEACACYARGVRDILSEHVDPSRLFVAQNTLDTRKLFELHRALDEEGRSAVRERLGIDDGHAVFVFVGQLVPRKGTRELLDVFGRIQRDTPATLLVIGGGPERESMETIVQSEGLRNVRFLGSLPLLEDSAPYVFSADATLIPGYVGLVATHSMGLGVPVITQRAPAGIPFHGPEVESVVDGENGFVTLRDLDALERGVREVIADRDAFSERALQYARDHLSSEDMISGLVQAIDHASK